MMIIVEVLFHHLGVRGRTILGIIIHLLVVADHTHVRQVLVVRLVVVDCRHLLRRVEVDQVHHLSRLPRHRHCHPHHRQERVVRLVQVVMLLVEEEVREVIIMLLVVVVVVVVGTLLVTAPVMREEARVGDVVGMLLLGIRGTGMAVVHQDLDLHL
jgi:hypothetical protein